MSAPLISSRRGIFQRDASLHQRQVPNHEDDLLDKDHDMVEPQQGAPQAVPSRARGVTLGGGRVRSGPNSRVSSYPVGARDDHNMGDQQQEDVEPQPQPTRGRTANTNTRSGVPTRVNTPEDTQFLSAPHRRRGLGQDDQRQSHSVPANRRNGPDVHDDPDQDGIDVEGPQPQARGRSRAPLSQHPDVFQSAGHTTQRLGRGQSTGPMRNRVDDQQPLQAPRHQEEERLDRFPAPSLHRGSRRPTQPETESRVPQASVAYRGSTIASSRNDLKINHTRSQSVEPTGGLQDVLLNQVVSSLREEIAVLVSQFSPFCIMEAADIALEGEVGELQGEMRWHR